MLTSRAALCLSVSLLSATPLACGDDAAGTGGSPSTSSATTVVVGQGPAPASNTTTASAGGGGEGCGLSLSSTYDAAGFDVNAADALSLRANFDALTGLMKSAETDLMVTPTAAELDALYQAGSPSVASLTTSAYDARLAGWFADFEAAAGASWVPAEPPVGAGGKFGSYIFTAEGTDLRQAVEKGLFTAAFYNHAVSLASGPVDGAALDALLAAYGAHPTFPGDSDAMTATYPDRIGAQYAERRSPKDPSDPSLPLDPMDPGPYFRIKGQFLRAQAAIAVGSACDAERDAAVASILSEWERVMFATVIFYLDDASVKLTTEPATEALQSGGLHGYGEVVGFIGGFRGLPAGSRVITDAQIDDLLLLLEAPDGGAAAGYQLVVDPAGNVGNLILAISQVADIYGFTAADIEAFKVSH